jgi:hypothetical protein
MRNFNPEVHRDNIRKVENVPESEWTMVKRQKKNQSSLSIITCTKYACNSKFHNEERCWWLHPHLRPNSKISSVPKTGSDIENNILTLNKVKTNHVSDQISLMKSHHDFILSKISIETNSEIRIH